IPQIGGMYEGDRSRKTTLVNYGFRLPSALDNRPLRFPEFENKINQVVFVSATPGPFELKKSLMENEWAKNLSRPSPFDKLTVVSEVEPQTRDTLSSSGESKKKNPSPGEERGRGEVAMPDPEQLRSITAVEQINRPTGVIDPTIEIHPIK